MTNTALRIYTTVIALICGGAVAWSIHQSSITTAWQADARSWHALAAQAVAHDRLTTRSMHADGRALRPARRPHPPLAAQAARQHPQGPAGRGRRHRERPDHLLQPSLVPAPAVSAPAPVAVAPAPAPTTHTSPAP